MSEMTPEPNDDDLPPYFHEPEEEPGKEPEVNRPEEHLEPEEDD